MIENEEKLRFAESEILKAHGLTRDDIDADGWILYKQRQNDLITLERLARLVCVNKRLEAHGLPGLPVKCEQTGRPTIAVMAKEPVHIPDVEPPTEEQRQVARSMGLSEEEHMFLKGDHANLLGLHLNEKIAKNMMAFCKKKQLRIVADLGDKHACRTLIIGRLKNEALRERKIWLRKAKQQEIKNALLALNNAHALCT